MALNFSGKKYLLFDGAMGTMLYKYGLQTGDRPETFNITHPDVVKKIHMAYIDAGSDIITTNTFGANEIRFSDEKYPVEEVVKAAVAIARSAAGGKMVALDIGPTGEFLEPLGNITGEKMYDIFKNQVLAALKVGVDLVIIETFADIEEARYAIRAVKENSSLPVICTFSFQKEGRTYMGYDVKTVTKFLTDEGVDALGVNCSVGPKDLLPIVEEMLKCTDLPVIVQPNAGLPEVKNGKVVYNITPSEFAFYMKSMAQMGVRILGGCCGTDPEFIREIKKSVIEAL